VTRFRHGALLGKFYPPHAGHQLLIEAAAAQCERVTVALMAASDETIPMALRHQWLEELAPPNVRVVSGIDDHPVDYDSPAAWAVHLALFQQLVGEAIDAVFTSEPYGAELGRRLGCPYVAVDVARDVVPVSGSAVRADPASYWWALGPSVRAWYCRRVVVIGAESTGTTTLARALAEHYDTAWVREYGRDHTVGKAAAGDVQWRDAEFALIARCQAAMEDAAARTVPIPLLVCDTDAYATTVWQERYLGHVTPDVAAISADRRCDLYVLTGDDIPFVQDGYRDGEHLRHWMTQRFRERLAQRPEPWVVVRGSVSERMRVATDAIDGLSLS
jgi:HTH-type transcriptional regulator, transcriptional repressor of NAD biosynthesis genes